MSEVRYPLTRPSSIQVLRNARTLIAERGWAAEGATAAPPPTGPLTLTGSLWAAARWGTTGQLVDPSAAGKACRLLCAVLWGKRAEQEDCSFVELGRWSRAEGRTQDDVLRLFDRTAVRVARAVQTFVADLEAMGEADVPCAACGADVNPLRDRCPQCDAVMTKEVAHV